MSVLKKINKYVPTLSMAIIVLAIIAACINIGYIASPTFADWFNAGVSNHLRGFLAFLTGWIPFSLSEFLILGSPVILVWVIVSCIRYVGENGVKFVRCIVGILSVILAVYVMFVFNFGAGYRTSTLDEKLEISSEKVTKEDLYNTVRIVVDRLAELEDEIIYAAKVGSVRPYSHDEAVKKLTESYALLHLEHDFIGLVKAPVKQLVVSEYMTYTHISGVYTFFTGEANLNTNYPYYVNVFTTAHEMAHQRGIARENEANFMAYLACINSDDPYLQYAGYLNMYEYLIMPLYKSSPALYSRVAVDLPLVAQYDLACYADFFEKYADNTAAKVSDTVNDTYLKSQGTEGSVSYGMVVELAVNYHRAEFSEE